MYFVIIAFILHLLYYILEKISDHLSFRPGKITDVDVNNLKKTFGKYMKLGKITTDDGQYLHYALYNDHKIPTWDDNITFYCHGNAGWIGTSLNGTLCSELSKYGSVFVFDYRGYGLSTGSPTESGLYKDVKSAWNFVTNIKKVSVDNIVVYGHSLGTSISSYLMKYLHDNGKKLPKTLILSAPFYNFATISTDLHPGIGRFNTNIFATNEYLKAIKNHINLIYIHSKNDEMIHHYHSYKLNIEAPGEFYMIDGTHSGSILSDSSRTAIYKACKISMRK